MTSKEMLLKIFPYAIGEKEKIYAEFKQKIKESDGPHDYDLTFYYVVTQRKLLKFYFYHLEPKVGYKCWPLDVFSHCEEEIVTKGKIKECNPDSDDSDDMPKKYTIRLFFNISEPQLHEIRITLESINNVTEVKKLRDFIKGFYRAVVCNEN